MILALDPGTRRTDGGRVLIGGSPLRIMRLTPGGAEVLDAIAAGEPVPDTAAGRRLTRRLTDAGMAHPRPAAARHQPGNVTVVVPHRGPVSGLERTLATVGPIGRVIVVDDGSLPPVVCDAEVVRHDAPRGPAAARNTGWRRATTELVAFVDSECEPDAAWLEPLLAHFGDPEVVAVAPRVAARPVGTLGRLVAAYEAGHSPLDMGPAEAIVRPRSRVAYVPSAALVVRRDALARVGGFDETMRFGEDVDLVWRLVAGGGRVRYEPAARVAHPTRPTLRALLRQRFDYGTSAAPLARRHGRAAAPLAVSGWSAGAWALAGAGHPFAGAAVAASTTALLAPRLRQLDHPWIEALRLAGLGHLFAGRVVADAVRRPWWPIALTLAAVRPRWRPAVVAAFLLPPVGPLDTAMRLLDDAAYGAGVWAGCIRERSARALVPDLASWPGRGQAVEPTIATNETISPG